jgi:hypothetical protein
MTTERTAAPMLRSVTRGATPLSSAGASFLAIPLAVIVIALGAIGIRDAIVAAGWIAGSPWAPTAANWLAARRPGAWMLPVGIVLAVVGLIFVVVAVKPRRKPAAELTAASAVFIDLTDAARISTAAAESIAGVVSARSSVRHGAVVVRCDVTAPLTTDQRDLVETAVSRELAALRVTPKIVVRTRTVTGR